MAITNHERVGKALELLEGGLGPFVEREFLARYQGDALAAAQSFVPSDRLNTGKAIKDWDSRRSRTDVECLERCVREDAWSCRAFIRQ